LQRGIDCFRLECLAAVVSRRERVGVEIPGDYHSIAVVSDRLDLKRKEEEEEEEEEEMIWSQHQIASTNQQASHKHSHEVEHVTRRVMHGIER